MFGKDLPFMVDFEQNPGAVLTVDAVAGARVLRTRIRSDLECIHVWGTTLIPFWSHVDC